MANIHESWTRKRVKWGETRLDQKYVTFENERKTVLFSDGYSNQYVGITCADPFEAGKKTFLDIKINILNRVLGQKSGTPTIMVGLTTRKWLSRDSYDTYHMLGRPLYLLRDTGDLIQKELNIPKNYTWPFYNRREYYLGLLYTDDEEERTLGFTLDNQFLGLAFTEKDLPPRGEDLYPVLYTNMRGGVEANLHLCITSKDAQPPMKNWPVSKGRLYSLPKIDAMKRYSRYCKIAGAMTPGWSWNKTTDLYKPLGPTFDGESTVFTGDRALEKGNDHLYVWSIYVNMPYGEFLVGVGEKNIVQGNSRRRWLFSVDNGKVSNGRFEHPDSEYDLTTVKLKTFDLTLVLNTWHQIFAIYMNDYLYDRMTFVSPTGDDLLPLFIRREKEIAFDLYWSINAPHTNEHAKTFFPAAFLDYDSRFSM